MVKREFTFPSADGKTAIHAVEWLPEGAPRAVLQIAHGVSEYVLRYEDFAGYLTERGFAVVGNDHLGHGLSVSDGAPRLYFGPKGSTPQAPAVGAATIFRMQALDSPTLRAVAMTSCT